MLGDFFFFFQNVRDLSTLSNRENRNTGRYEIGVDGWRRVLKEES